MMFRKAIVFKKKRHFHPCSVVSCPRRKRAEQPKGSSSAAAQGCRTPGRLRDKGSHRKKGIASQKQRIRRLPDPLMCLNGFVPRLARESAFGGSRLGEYQTVIVDSDLDGLAFMQAAFQNLLREGILKETFD